MLYTAEHYSKAYDWPLRHFTPKEVADSRTDEIRLWVPFGRKMDLLRSTHGQAIFVTSWYRDEDHDREIGGKGNHCGGWAADIWSHNKYKLLHDICAVQFAGVGIARSFFHVDDNRDYIDQEKRPALWTYG